MEKLQLVSKVMDDLRFTKRQEALLLAWRHHLPPFAEVETTTVDLAAIQAARENHNREGEK